MVVTPFARYRQGAEKLISRKSAGAFGDTSVAVVRCWLEPATTRSTVVPAGQDAYLALGESALTASRLFQGLILSSAIILGLC
jgi:hypothetical protein